MGVMVVRESVKCGRKSRWFDIRVKAVETSEVRKERSRTRAGRQSRGGAACATHQYFVLLVYQICFEGSGGKLKHTCRRHWDDTR